MLLTFSNIFSTVKRHFNNQIKYYLLSLNPDDYLLIIEKNQLDLDEFLIVKV